jgi:hypothetical protein
LFPFFIISNYYEHILVWYQIQNIALAAEDERMIPRNRFASKLVLDSESLKMNNQNELGKGYTMNDIRSTCND